MPHHLTKNPASKSENRLLTALPYEAYQRVLPSLELVSLALRQVVYVPNETVAYVYFPFSALISLVTLLEDGSTVENSLVGKEGMVGIQAFLGNGTMPQQAIVQIEDGGVRMPVAAFRAEFNQHGAVCGRSHTGGCASFTSWFSGLSRIDHCLSRIQRCHSLRIS